MLAAAGLFAGLQGEQDPGHRLQAAAGDIGKLNRGDARRSSGLAGEIQHTGLGQVVDIVTGAPAQRPALAVSADRTADNARVDFGEAVVVDCQTLHHPGTKSFDDHIGRLHQPVKNLPALIGFQIQGHVLLVAHDGRDKKRVGPITPVLHSDDAGTVIGQHHRAVRSGQQPGEIDHRDTGQRACIFHESVSSFNPAAGIKPARYFRNDPVPSSGGRPFCSGLHREKRGGQMGKARLNRWLPGGVPKRASQRMHRTIKDNRRRVKHGAGRQRPAATSGAAADAIRRSAKATMGSPVDGPGAYRPKNWFIRHRKWFMVRPDCFEVRTPKPAPVCNEAIG